MLIKSIGGAFGFIGILRLIEKNLRKCLKRLDFQRNDVYNIITKTAKRKESNHEKYQNRRGT